MLMLLRIPLTIFDRFGVAGHQSLVRNHLAYYDWRRNVNSAPTILFVK